MRPKLVKERNYLQHDATGEALVGRKLDGFPDEFLCGARFGWI
jgi:hypothetical protein